MPNVSLGGLATFNMQHGFVESIVRGFRSGFLQDETYHHLTQCETLEVSSLPVLSVWLAMISMDWLLTRCWLRRM